MSWLGQIVAIEIVSAGSFVVGPVAPGATILPVDDMVDFFVNGGSLVIDGTPAVYLSAVDDDAGDYLTLAAPLAAGAVDGALVYVDPPLLAKWALVAFPMDIDGATVLAEVPSGHLWADARLAEGATGGQPVELAPGPGGAWVVVGILGTAPSAHGAFITPGTVTAEALDDDLLGEIRGGRTINGGTW